MSQKIKIGVIGAGGRIGRELLALIQNSSTCIAAVGVGRKSEGFTENIVSPKEINGEAVDVLIDFSSPEMFLETLAICIEKKIPLVSGTTGISDLHHSKMKELSASSPVLWAPNMSLGIAILKNSLKVFKAARHFDFQVEEWHHRHKKDSPSGTAIFIQNELEKVIEKKCPPTMVMRGGGIYGVHKVYAASDEELIQFEHTAINRTVFARGALVAAQWLKNHKSGLYTMDDVIS